MSKYAIPVKFLGIGENIEDIVIGDIVKSLSINNMPDQSTPLLEYMDWEESITIFGIDSKGTKDLCSAAYSEINLPSEAYTLVTIGGS